jgi:tripartite-type tricarboxylate transporter receptor subunit TctC
MMADVPVLVGVEEMRTCLIVTAGFVFGSVSLLLSVSDSPAQEFPAKPIRLIVTGPAGSPPDDTSRWIAHRLSPALGVPIIVENRVGANGAIALSAVAKSTPDGHTIGFITQAHVAFSPFLYPKLGYDPLKDFAPITRMASAPYVLVVNGESKVTSLAELVRIAQKTPGELTVGSGPLGSAPYMAGELFRLAAKIDVRVIPFAAGNLAMMEVMADRITYSLALVGNAASGAKAGKLRMLAISSAKRFPALPEVPTFAERGLPDAKYETWSGIVAPAGTSPAIVARLAAEIRRAYASPEGIAQTRERGGEPILDDTPETFAAVIREDHATWGEFIRRAGIKLE